MEKRYFRDIDGFVAYLITKTKEEMDLLGVKTELSEYGKPVLWVKRCYEGLGVQKNQEIKEGQEIYEVVTFFNFTTPSGGKYQLSDQAFSIFEGLKLYDLDRQQQYYGSSTIDFNLLTGGENWFKDNMKLCEKQAKEIAKDLIKIK